MLLNCTKLQLFQKIEKKQKKKKEKEEKSGESEESSSAETDSLEKASGKESGDKEVEGKLKKRKEKVHYLYLIII